MRAVALDVKSVLMKAIAKIGLVSLAVGVAIGGSLPVKADQPVDYWSVRGLTRPGAWFQKYNTEKPATIGVSKSGQGVGEQKPAKSKAGKRHTSHIGATNKGY